MQRVHADFAYLLHSKPYRDNSALVYLLTEQNGKISCIVGGMKSKKHNKRALLQPCHRLRIDYELKSGLSKLTDVDTAPPLTVPPITRFMLYQYVNELLLNVLPEQLPVPPIFAAYQQCLSHLDHVPHTALRIVELSLIEHFGGLPELGITQDTQQPPAADSEYYFYPDAGIYALPQPYNGKRFDGSHLQAFWHLLQHGTAQTNETLAQGAMPVSSYLIQQLLGNKPLKTRAVYKALQGFTDPTQTTIVNTQEQTT